MINYDSILSAFDGKPTLLQWLKLVKKALDESVLKDITLKQDGAQVVFTFNFEDGTSISTPVVTLPKGDTGATGAKGDTGATGAKGDAGVSVTGVDEVSDEVVGTQTLTTLRFHFSDGTNNEVVVYAKNGKAGEKVYQHFITITPTTDITENIHKYDGTVYTPSVNIAPNYRILIYTNSSNPINSVSEIPAAYYTATMVKGGPTAFWGTIELSIYRSSESISVSTLGVVFGSNSQNYNYKTSFTNSKIDTITDVVTEL